MAFCHSPISRTFVHQAARRRDKLIADMQAQKSTKTQKSRIPQKPADSDKLGRDDWLDAAFDAVVEGGFDKVRVLLLAETLGVTRGSFYWHFADHAELVTSLLARWRERELAIGQMLESEPLGEPQADLERLLDFALAHAGADLENMRFELALRGLGRRDPNVADMLAEIDQLRMGLFEHKFERLTGEPQKAADLAALFYLAIVGSYQALARPLNPPQLEQYLKGIIGQFLIHGQAPNRPAAGQAPGQSG
jgi:AcrR family transcriptional regulator